MRNSAEYARAHKGEGTRRTLDASYEEAYQGMADAFAKIPQAELSKEDHALFAVAQNVDMTYAAYFYPASAGARTDVEVLLASPWLAADKIRGFESQLLQGVADHLDAERYRRGKRGGASPKAPAADAVAPPAPTAPARALSPSEKKAANEELVP